MVLGQDTDSPTRILNDFSYSFQKGEKIGIVGPNGVGKTTFMKVVSGQYQLTSGKRILGDTVQFGFYEQDGLQVCYDFSCRCLTKQGLLILGLLTP